MAAPTFGASASGFDWSATDEVDVTLPSGMSDGAWVVIAAYVSDAAVTISWPSGWTEGDQATQGSATGGWCYRRVLASESSSVVTIGFSANCTGAARANSFSGVQLFAAGFEGLAANTGASGTVSSSAVTTRGPDRLAVILSGYDITTARLAGYSGFTQRQTGSQGGTRRYIDDQTIASAQTVSAQTFVVTGTPNWFTWSFALLPRIARAQVVSA